MVGEKGFLKLFSRIDDRRKGKNKVAVLCPVGDLGMLKGFLKILREQGFKEYDLLLIYPSGMEFYDEKGFSIIHAGERLPLGTSGCFFAGQAFLYSQGYEIVVVADIDALPSSPDMLGALVEESRKTRKVCVPLSVVGKDSVPDKNYFVINQYGAYPRSVFEKAGFITPYFWRGAEDWEMTNRVREMGLLNVVEDLAVYHPREGMRIYEKIANKKKFYPYVNGFLRAFLFRSGSKISYLIGYLARYVFYRFFSVAFQDKELAKCLFATSSFRIISYSNEGGNLNVERKEEGVAPQGSFLGDLLLPFEVLLLGKVSKGPFSISAKSRLSLLVFLLLGTIYSPFSLVEALIRFLEWGSSRKKVEYPVFPGNVDSAITIYEKYLKEKAL